MKTNIQIRSIKGNLLFEYEKNYNTLNETLKEAKRKGKTFRDADLSNKSIRYVNLKDMDFRRALFKYSDLIGLEFGNADLAYTSFEGAHISDSNFVNSNITGIRLWGAYFKSTDFKGAKHGRIIIKKLASFAGLCDFEAVPIISMDNNYFVRLGTDTKKIYQWEEYFKENTGKPLDKNIKSKFKLFAFETCKKWIEINSI